MKKSIALGIVLAILLGPLGLLYSSIVGGILLIVAALVLGAGSPILAPITWLVAIIWAPVAVSLHNAEVDKTLANAITGAQQPQQQPEPDSNQEDWDTLVKYDQTMQEAHARVAPHGDKAIAELKKAHAAIKDKDQLLRIADQIARDYV